MPNRRKYTYIIAVFDWWDDAMEKAVELALLTGTRHKVYLSRLDRRTWILASY